MNKRSTYNVIPLIGFSLFLVGCAPKNFVRIVVPNDEQTQIGTPHDLAAECIGWCPPIDTFEAYLDEGQSGEVDLTDQFVFQMESERWIASLVDLPPGTHTLTVSTDQYSGSDLVGRTSDSCTIEVIADCPQGSYCAYFLDHPRVATVTIHSLDQTALGYFWEYINDLETTGVITIAEPMQLQACIEPEFCDNIFMTEDEHAHVLAAKHAHAVWLDKNAMLPWSLEEYSNEELEGLFSSEWLFDRGLQQLEDGSYAMRYLFIMLVDHSPSEVYGYMIQNNLIGVDQLATLHAVLEDVRTTDERFGFLHGAADLYDDPINTACTLHHALTTYSDRGYAVVRIARGGCYSMTRTILGMLRSVNIPGIETKRGEWFDYGHSSAVCPALGLVLPHGDDVYGASLYAVPSQELLPELAFYEDAAHAEVCADDAVCRSHRHRAILAARYPSQYTLERCCSPQNYNFENCDEYLTDSYHPYLTLEEITQASEVLREVCEELGS